MILIHNKNHKIENKLFQRKHPQIQNAIHSLITRFIWNRYLSRGKWKTSNDIYTRSFGH